MCLLAAASQVFDKVFSAQLKENHTNECEIDYIPAYVFEHLLNFIYPGESPKNLNEDDLSRRLFEAAHYQIEDHKDVCKQEEQPKLSALNALEMYRWALTYDLEDLIMDELGTLLNGEEYVDVEFKFSE